MSQQLAQLQEATIKQHCKSLRMPMIASQFSAVAEQAVREKKSHIGYLEALLAAEIEERERNTIDRRIKEAHLPRVKTLGCWNSPRVAISIVPNQFCSLANAGPGKRIFSAVFAWRPAGRNGVFVLRRPPRW